MENNNSRCERRFVGKPSLLYLDGYVSKSVRGETGASIERTLVPDAVVDNVARRQAESIISHLIHAM